MRASGPLIHLGTRCSSIDEFVERFAQFTTDSSLVMPASADAKVGLEGRFVIRLKDQTTVMSGRCRVEEVRPVSAGAGGGKTVMRVRLLSMDEASRKVHRQLLAGKRPAAPPPPPVVKPPPLRIVRAPTLIGTAPPPIGTAKTLIGAAAPPFAVAPDTVPSLAPVPMAVAEAAVEATEPSRIPVETRVPGASFTLPANPLSDLDAADLASFVECTLFEASGDSEGAEAPPEPAHDAKTPLVELTDPATGRVSPAKPLPGVELEADAPPAATRDVLKRRLVTAAPYALCTIVGVLVGGVLHRSPPSPASAPRAAILAPAPSTPQAPPIVAKPARAAPPAVEEKAAPAALEACLATITSEPDGAVVLWGERRLGVTPLRDAPVPCGAATVTMRHERYREVHRAVTAEPGPAVAVDERLKRPGGTLVLTSSPPRASFTVNGQRVGLAPRTLGIWRYEHLKIEATLPGHRPWSKTVYVQEATMKIEARLASGR